MTPEVAANDNGSTRNLTRRERNVLITVARGASYQTAAERLAIAPGTIEQHMSTIYAKTGTSTPYQAALLAVSEGVVPVRAIRNDTVVASLPSLSLVELKIVATIGDDLGSRPNASRLGKQIGSGEKDALRYVKSIRDKLGVDAPTAALNVLLDSNEYPPVEPRKTEETAEPALSAREMEILSLCAQGKKPKEIKGILYISSKTVKNHLANIHGKLGVGQRLNAMLVALDENLFPPDEVEKIRNQELIDRMAALKEEGKLTKPLLDILDESTRDPRAESTNAKVAQRLSKSTATVKNQKAVIVAELGTDFDTIAVNYYLAQRDELANNHPAETAILPTEGEIFDRRDLVTA